MTYGDELEAALQARWSFDELEVYADYLLGKHDVRGDIVALDLIPRPEQQTWVQRRRAALSAWIGNSLAARAGHLVQHGFIHDLRDGMAPVELLDSEAGTYLRSYTTWGATRVEKSLARLAEKRRPWLSRLTIAHHGPNPLPDALVKKLIAATPRLDEITISGRPPFDAFPHPAVKRARLDAQCYAIEIDAPKTRIVVPDRCPGPRIPADDLDLLVQLVELAPDCNQLYTHGEQFTEPLPSLITRLAAAGIVELAGPVVYIASPGMVLEPRFEQQDLDDLTLARAWIEGERWIEIGSLRPHTNLIRACLERLPIAARMYDTLREYYGQWQRAQNARVTVDAARCTQYRRAMNALLELRGLWPVEIEGWWDLIEELGASIPFDGAYFRAGYYDWYG